MTVTPASGPPRPDAIPPVVSPMIRPLVEQAAAICLRGAPGHGGIEVLLIASRGTGEWGLPKGHIEPGELSHQAARREAYEEVGVVGEPDEAILDVFRYSKPGHDADYRVAVHLMPVSRMLDVFPESGRRTIQWVPLGLASRWVANTHLAGILDTAFHFSMLKAHSGRSPLDRRAKPAGDCHARFTVLD